MLELVVGLILASSCDITAASLGQCGCDSSISGQFTLCAGIQTQAQVPGTTLPIQQKPVPLRLCSYYANGTIDVPTISVITTWVEVGSRLCIGDEVSEWTQISPPRTIEDDLSDSITAVSNRPEAWWEPGDEVEFEDVATFRVSRGGMNFVSDILGESAEIRFIAVSARWVFSDGDTGSGFAVPKSFAEIGNYTAQGYVSYQVDYRIGSGGWVLNAASWELAANPLSVPVVEYPRRTLLVQP